MKPTTQTSTKTNNILITLLLASFLVAYFPVWKSLVSAWSSSEEYSHGFLIIPVFAYIIWRKKYVLTKTSSKPSLWGLAIVLLSLLFYLFAHFAEIATVASFSMVLLVAGIIAYLYGFTILKELSFPLFILLFMIPAPSQIYASLTIPLQLCVTKASVFIAALIDVPIYRAGNVIHLPDRTFQVVQACSGLRSMVALLTLSAILGYFSLRSNLLRTILFVSGIPAAIVVNIFRVLILVLVFHYTGMDLSKGSLHTVFGMAIFVLALILIFLMRGVLSIWDPRPAER